MSKELQDFYIAIHQWLITNAWGSRANPCDFRRTVGLCANLSHFGEYLNKSHGGIEVLQNEMAQSFVDANRDKRLPFNGSIADFHAEVDKYHNLARLKWIQDHLPKESK